MADRPDAVQYLNVNEAVNGTHALVAGEAGKRVLLVNMTLIAAGAVVVTLEDGPGGADRIGPWSFAANGGISSPDSQVGWTRTASGQGLNIRLSANVQVAGSIAYRMMPDHVEL